MAQVHIVPTPATLPSLSQPAFMTSGEVPYNQLKEGENSQAWFTNGSSQYIDTSERRQPQHYSLSQGHHDGQW